MTEMPKLNKTERLALFKLDLNNDGVLNLGELHLSVSKYSPEEPEWLEIEKYRKMAVSSGNQIRYFEGFDLNRDDQIDSGLPLFEDISAVRQRHLMNAINDNGVFVPQANFQGFDLNYDGEVDEEIFFPKKLEDLSPLRQVDVMLVVAANGFYNTLSLADDFRSDFYDRKERIQQERIPGLMLDVVKEALEEDGAQYQVLQEEGRAHIVEVDVGDDGIFDLAVSKEGRVIINYTDTRERRDFPVYLALARLRESPPSSCLGQLFFGSADYVYRKLEWPHEGYTLKFDAYGVILTAAFAYEFLPNDDLLKVNFENSDLQKGWYIPVAPLKPIRAVPYVLGVGDSIEVYDIRTGTFKMIQLTDNPLKEFLNRKFRKRHEGEI